MYRIYTMKKTKKAIRCSVIVVKHISRTSNEINILINVYLNSENVGSIIRSVITYKIDVY